VANEKRIPKENDRVGALGHYGVMVVVSVDEKTKTVDLRAVGVKGEIGNITHGIPWTALTFLDPATS